MTDDYHPKITTLRSLLDTQNLPSTIPLTDDLLRRFIIAKKEPERALEPCTRFIRLMNTIDTESLDWEEDIVPMLNWIWSSVPLLRDIEGRPSIVVRVQNFYPRKFGMKRSAVMFYLMLQVVIRELEDQERGIHVVLDVTGLGVSNFDPSVQKSLIGHIQNTFPVRVKLISVVNAGWMFSKIFSVLKAMMSKKMKSRFHTVSKEELLEEYGDNPDVLPDTLGGSLSFESQYEEWVELLREEYEILKAL
eukprot:TRINITY_DN13470_c0_g1_i1.p1 TRINITY_DN13470_c0_g1~~TRINITY_DN13470_c0_g1_i1.p1  ORF type:complete len:255 (-),score=54.41 TRINITY_DN13470_c0_g1_i1:25-768(-)